MSSRPVTLLLKTKARSRRTAFINGVLNGTRPTDENRMDHLSICFNLLFMAPPMSAP